MNVKEQFIKLYTNNIKRDDSDRLLQYLEDNGFFDAPASTKYHGNYEGGLAEHSVNVYYALIDVLTMIYGSEFRKMYNDETIAIVSLLHDLCKIDKYKKAYKNVKDNDTGIWEQIECFEYNNDQVRLGHGSASVYIIQDYMKLTPEEKQAIHWHMGAFDTSQYNSTWDLGNAYQNNTLAFALHLADMVATYVDENEKFKPIPLEEEVTANDKNN